MLTSAKHSIELSREARSDQRRVIAALQAQEGSTGSDLLRFNQLKVRLVVLFVFLYVCVFILVYYLMYKPVNLGD